MPAVVQLFLLIAVFLFAIAPNGSNSVQLPKFVVALGVAAITLFVSCLVSATIPVFNRRERVISGEQAFVAQGDMNRAILEFGAGP